MGRIIDLKEYANNACVNYKVGSYKKRKSMQYAINRFIDCLATTRQVPPKWYALTTQNIIAVTEQWKKSNLKNSTIMKYLSQIRCFLEVINHHVDGIDNKSLNLALQASTVEYEFTDSVLKKVYDPLVLNLLLLQTEFGLTYSESIRFRPDIHYQEGFIWLTREITANSLDRTIPFLTEKQNNTFKDLLQILPDCNSSISQFGEELTKMRYRTCLKQLKLSAYINYRFVYAKSRYEKLIIQMDSSKACEIIQREMGVSYRTLRRYLGE